MSKAPQKTPSKTKDSTEPQTRLVRALADIMDEAALTRLKFEDENVSISLSKDGGKGGGMPASMPASAPASAPAPAPAAPVSAETAIPENALTSPMVGRTYLAPEPGAAPFVKEGDAVKAGQTLLIIEAMKVMNPITATSGGVVRRILVEDAQPVEFGEALIVID